MIGDPYGVKTKLLGQMSNFKVSRPARLRTGDEDTCTYLLDTRSYPRVNASAAYRCLLHVVALP